MGWKDFFAEESGKDYYAALMSFLDDEYSRYTVYPPRDDLFASFELTPYESAKVVILGQDPYHQPHQAHGLSFSVRMGVKPPPSLQNIYKELQSDLGIEPPSHGCLESWARQGVFLLNTVMSVREGAAGSHSGKGWELFTDNAVRYLNRHSSPLVFILWGARAHAKEALIKDHKHLIIKSAHPSPLSAYKGFFGSRPFSQANSFLRLNDLTEISWNMR